MREIEKQTSLYNKQPCCTWWIKCYQKISDARDRKNKPRSTWWIKCYQKISDAQDRKTNLAVQQTTLLYLMN